VGQPFTTGREWKWSKSILIMIINNTVSGCLNAENSYNNPLGIF
jgi:hypothetical protein